MVPRPPLKFIPDENSRKLTLRRRSMGLMKKAHELSTLCGIDTCLIIYDPSSFEPVIYPSNPERLQSILDRYRCRREEKKWIKHSDLSGVLEERTKKTKEQSSESGNYACDDDRLNDFSGEQLKQLLSACGPRLEFVKSRVEFLKTMNQISSHSSAPMINPNARPDYGTPSTAEYFAPAIPEDSTRSALPAPTFLCDRKPIKSDNFHNSAPATIPAVLHYHQNVAAPLQWIPVMVSGPSTTSTNFSYDFNNYFVFDN